MLAFIPGTQELADFLITVVISVVGSAWGGAWFILKRREQTFLMQMRKRDANAQEVKEIREMNMREEEHTLRMRAVEQETVLRTEVMKQLAGNGKLELTSDGRLKPKS